MGACKQNWELSKMMSLQDFTEFKNFLNLKSEFTYLIKYLDFVGFDNDKVKEIINLTNDTLTLKDFEANLQTIKIEIEKFKKEKLVNEKIISNYLESVLQFIDNIDNIEG